AALAASCSLSAAALAAALADASISAAAVGLVAQAGTALSRKIVVSHPTLAVCALAAAVAVLYSAPWLEPVLIAAGGVASLCWSYWAVVSERKRKKKTDEDVEGADVEEVRAVEMSQELGGSDEKLLKPEGTAASETSPEGQTPFGWRTGISIFVVWTILLITFMALKKTVPDIRPLAVFMQFYVAGCVIFGGGPVVIPLLYSYVVIPGWLNPRDFLLGVALIQAMPGPNFNFAAYCGALALSPYGAGPAIAGALLGYVGIFSPGLALNAAALPLWQR
ncbi:hypothetical protein HK104_007998, partial [Borealophlyctis nickersoniae]